MLFKTLSIFLVVSLGREGEVGGFSTNKIAVAGRRHLTRSDDQIPTQETFETRTMVIENSDANRREILKNGLAIFSLSAFGIVLGSTPGPAWADVSDGNALPQGAAQFGRVVRAKTDLLGVQKRVEQGASEMDKVEWDNVGAFLRRVYGVSEDMKAIASGFDSAKKQRAAELIDNLKKFSKAADAPTGTQNAPEFLAYAKKLTSILDEFLDLLSDIPDEI